ncbi:hypothetical protein NCC49_002141 [Naganishia albida]|nr:hypothetical protein NCC49_002141 [Naganishia albida]
MNEELKGLAEEEAGVIARLRDLFGDGMNGKVLLHTLEITSDRELMSSCASLRFQNLGKIAPELRAAAMELIQVDTGCLDVWQTLSENERNIPAQLLGARIDPSELDSGRNVGAVREEAVSGNDLLPNDMARENLETPNVEVRLSATKNRSAGRNRR